MTHSGFARLPLLPATMVGLIALLTVKSAGLVRMAYAAAEASVPPPAVAEPAAKADGIEKPNEKPGSEAHPAAQAKPEAGAATKAPAMAAPEHVLKPPEPEPMPSAAERALLLDLRKRRAELDAREAALAAREAMLGAAEKRIAARVDELTSLQTRLEALEAARRDRDEASWRGLVRVYETMKPKDAAMIFDDLDSAVLLQVVDRMKDGKAAAVMAAMAPDRARRLTADLSQLRARANAPPAAPQPDIPPPHKPGPPAPGASP